MLHEVAHSMTGDIDKPGDHGAAFAGTLRSNLGIARPPEEDVAIRVVPGHAVAELGDQMGA